MSWRRDCQGARENLGADKSAHCLDVCCNGFTSAHACQNISKYMLEIMRDLFYVDYVSIKPYLKIHRIVDLK